jgi:hypothetical protein
MDQRTSNKKCKVQAKQNGENKGFQYNKERELFTFLIINTMDVASGNYTCSHSYLLIEEESSNVETVDNKKAEMAPILFEIDHFDPKKAEQQNGELYLCTCVINIRRVTIAVNIFATITNAFSLIILTLAIASTLSLDSVYSFHGDLTRLELNELNSALAQSIAVTFLSIVFGITALVGLLNDNICLTLPNLVWLIVGYVLTVVINVQAAASVSNFTYGMENVMLHFVIMCCLFIPNVIFIMHEFINRFKLMPSKTIDYKYVDGIETSYHINK